MILRTVAGPGDEVIFVSPPWFFYEAMIAGAGATPVRVSIDATTLDLDLGAIEGAITAKTAAIIVNTPHNPTGKIYPAETLRGWRAS
jgi:aspartate aminotransferase